MALGKEQSTLEFQMNAALEVALKRYYEEVGLDVRTSLTDDLERELVLAIFQKILRTEELPRPSRQVS